MESKGNIKLWYMMRATLYLSYVSIIFAHALFAYHKTNITANKFCLLKFCDMQIKHNNGEYHSVWKWNIQTSREWNIMQFNKKHNVFLHFQIHIHIFLFCWNKLNKNISNKTHRRKSEIWSFKTYFCFCFCFFAIFFIEKSE